MPVLTWKRIAAAILLFLGMLLLAAGTVLSNIVLLVAGGLILAAVIGLAVLATYRRVGFSIHLASQQQRNILALTDALAGMDHRLLAVDKSIRHVVGSDLRHLVLNSFRDVDDRLEELVSVVGDGKDRVSVGLGGLEAQVSSLQAAISAGNKSLVRHDSGIAEIAGKLQQFRAELAGLEAASGKGLEALVSTVASRLQALKREIGGGRLRFDILNDALVMERLAQRVPLVNDAPPLMSGWSLDPPSLLRLLELVEERKPSLIVECGSGVSTIWLAQVVSQYGGRVVALEHLEQYVKPVRDDLERHELAEIAEVRYAPLEQYQLSGSEYSWYARDAWEGLAGVDMLLVDGPPKATGPHARFPAIPLLGSLLKPNATLVLDDVHREEEQEVLSMWRSAVDTLGPGHAIGPRTVAMEWMPGTKP